MRAITAKPMCSSLHDNNTPALIADGQMRKRDERFADQAKHKAKPDPLHDKKASGEPPEGQHFRPKDFSFKDEDRTATCPGGQVLTSSGRIHITASGQPLPDLHGQGDRLWQLRAARQVHQDPRSR